jgi:hypothetical protein
LNIRECAEFEMLCAQSKIPEVRRVWKRPGRPVRKRRQKAHAG